MKRKKKKIKDSRTVFMTMYSLFNIFCNLVNATAVTTGAERRPFNCFKQDAAKEVIFVFLVKYCEFKPDVH